MQELYSIMRDLLEVEYNQKSLLYMLKELENSYRNEQDRERWITNSIRYYLEALQRELKGIISRFDLYMAERAKEKIN